MLLTCCSKQNRSCANNCDTRTPFTGTTSSQASSSSAPSSLSRRRPLSVPAPKSFISTQVWIRLKSISFSRSCSTALPSGALASIRRSSVASSAMSRAASGTVISPAPRTREVLGVALRDSGRASGSAASCWGSNRKRCSQRSSGDTPVTMARFCSMISAAG